MKEIRRSNITTLKNENSESHALFDRVGEITIPASTHFETHELYLLELLTRGNMVRKAFEKPFVFKVVLTKLSFFPL